MDCVFVLSWWVISTYIGSGYPFVLWGSCFWCVCVQYSSCCVRKDGRYWPKHVVIFCY